MAFKDYSTTPASNTTLGDGTYIGPDMLRNKVRPALQQLAADGKDLANAVDAIVFDATTAQFQGPGTGTVRRSVGSKLSDSISADDYGTAGDGVADDTAAINSALAYASANGKALSLGIGKTYKFSQLVIPAGTAPVVIHGNGATLVKSGATGVGLLVQGSSGGTVNRRKRCIIRDLYMVAGVTQTSGAMVKAIYCDNLKIENSSIESAFIAVDVSECLGTRLSHLYIRNSQNCDINLYGSSAGTSCIDTFIDGVLGEGVSGNTTKTGVRIDSGVSGVFISNSDFTQGSIGVDIQKNGALKPEFILATNTLCDTNANYGWAVTGDVRGLYLTNCWGSTCANNSGIDINAGSNVVINGFTAYNNGKHGANIAAAAKNVTINSGSFACNSALASNTYHGINVAGGVTDLSIHNVRAGNLLELNLPGLQAYGIFLAAGATDRVNISGGNLTGNQTGALQSTGVTGTNNKVSGIIGVNPTDTFGAAHIDPRELGMDYSTTTAALATLQAAVNLASTTGKPLYIPRHASIFRVNGTVTIPAGGISIYGGGQIYSNADLPLFKLVGASVRQSYCDFEAVFELGTGIMPTAACAIELASTSGTAFIERNTFDNVRCIGGIATIINSSATYTTSFGEESAANWNTFNDISNIDRFGGEARNVIWFKAGSGTGNTYSAIKGQLGATASAFFRFDGSGCVVGDIILPFPQTSAGTGGTVDCAVLEVGPNTAYRSNIQIVGGQADSRVTRVFRLSSVGVSTAPYYNINHEGSLVGGATVLGIDVPVSTMRITDRDGGTWRGGGAWGATGTGAKTIPVCKVTMLSGLYNGVRLTLFTNGLVGGVAGGNNKTDISLTSDGTTVTATTVSNSPNPSGLFNVSYTVVGLVVTINITLTPTASPSKGHVTWEAFGNDFFLERLI